MFNLIFIVLKQHCMLFFGGLIGAIMFIPFVTTFLINYLTIMGMFWGAVFVILVLVEFLKLNK